ncbi:TetR/AcrR family transcriptional regulator [Actinosynnema mirum]|uniref:Transcriptional regulator, TetR family n=1 Tax=Actinosynnema mirum (strain ATCC 29888 / DSM 43827 / JCM 3225 / NBRC 14064 / NCIMB 13271 / NRRL B-12336 / IMRU 3971 / 101) TaxID=446462 RepID=C6WQH3_ACTMD|nr:TetR/AcrR family transcriptional regulator [Actinosynnema mirum]ACU36827.1 transcriptional regulator, TetR family [Actinosynnema mirum DSM 43827]
MTREAAGKRGYHHGDLRRAVIDAVLDLVWERGAHGFSLAEAARRAGVSVAAPYRHFADREAVLAAAATEGFDALADVLLAAQGNAGEGRLAEEFAAAYVAFALESPARFTVMFAARLDKPKYPDLMTAADRTGPPLRAAVEHLPDPDGAVARVWAIAHGAATLAVEGVLTRYHATGETADSVVRSAVRDWEAGAGGRGGVE